MSRPIRIAILDLYEGVPNQGMRCLREIISNFGKECKMGVVFDEYEVRIKCQVPDLSYDIYISSGGPGSPLESEGSEWESKYFKWLKNIEAWNHDPTHVEKKKVLFICHSFQLACRFYKVAEVTRRKSTAFGIFPVHLMHNEMDEPVFKGLADPFYAVDSRDFQVVRPHHNRLKNMGGQILCIEKERPHVPLERAIMGIRFSQHMIGTQFHPEADAQGMSMYLQSEEKKKVVIENYGFEKWKSMIDHLEDPEKISWTHAHVIPNFLRQAVVH